MKLHDHRINYIKGELDENAVLADPFAQFRLWFEEALSLLDSEANAMVLATASASGAPSARVVLLKELNEKGFVFFTNYGSRKGHDIAENPQGQLLFFWGPLERQVRISGRLEKISAAESDEYFYSRPLESQYGAMASVQSSPLASRAVLEEHLRELMKGAAQRPENWGGYVLVADYFEFWQGRPSRLHDRICFSPAGDRWQTARLSP